jgi:hypothetical protein
MKGTMKFAVLVGASVLALPLLAISNPNREDYLKHAAWNFQDKPCKQDPIPLPAKVACWTSGVFPPEMATKPLNYYSRRQDYVLFSLYTTDIWGMKTKTVGIAGHFFDL